MGLQGKTINDSVNGQSNKKKPYDGDKKPMALTTSRIKTTARTKMLLNAGEGHVGSVAGFATNLLNGTATSSTTTSNFVMPISGCSIGDTIVSARMLGATTVVEAKTLAWTLYKCTKSAATITATSVQAMTSDTTATAHAVDVETILTTPLKIEDDYQYFFVITITTTATASFELTGIELDVKRTFGQEK